MYHVALRGAARGNGGGGGGGMPLRGGHAHAPSAEVLGEYNHLTPIPRENLDGVGVAGEP